MWEFDNNINNIRYATPQEQIEIKPEIMAEAYARAQPMINEYRIDEETRQKAVLEKFFNSITSSLTQEAKENFLALEGQGIYAIPLINSALHLAVAANNKKLVKFFSYYAYITATNKLGETSSENASNRDKSMSSEDLGLKDLFANDPQIPSSPRTVVEVEDNEEVIELIFPTKFGKNSLFAPKETYYTHHTHHHHSHHHHFYAHCRSSVQREEPCVLSEDMVNPNRQEACVSPSTTIVNRSSPNGVARHILFSQKTPVFPQQGSTPFKKPPSPLSFYGKG